ncbi:MAG: hypothetical protein Q9160_007758 [Pyrenula sp. 1 TL-2023]
MATNKRSELSLYLVTDSTPAILGGRDLPNIVENAILGGVTIVQYRDKHSDTGEMIAMAERLHAITQKHNVPLIINDRVDVALAVGAEGVHLGQDDMKLETARRLMGNDAIIGISANSIEEAQGAVASGADYLGIGAMYATTTKNDTKAILGPYGTQNILAGLASTSEGESIPTVAIGGINGSNAQRIFFQSRTAKKSLSGLAVVSCIIASDDPYSAASSIREALSTSSTLDIILTPTVPDTSLPKLLSHVPELIASHATTKPLSHNMTNLVVQNFAANVCLASGSSPIMSNNGLEASSLARIPHSALVINMGTVTPESLTNYKLATAAYNTIGHPIVLDPVGAGATEIRKAALTEMLDTSFFTLIKGNESEIQAVARVLLRTAGSQNSSNQQRGVDSGPSKTSVAEKASLVSLLARRTHSIILMTGSTDVLADPLGRAIAISNGHPLLGSITGSGCALGSVLSSFLASHSEDRFLAALAGVLIYEIAAEDAAKVSDGPGTFVPRFLDELSKIKENGGKGIDQRTKTEWLKV